MGVDCMRYIGFITRQYPSRLSLEESRVFAVTECPDIPPIGSYVVVESNDRSYLARVVEVIVQDIYAIARTPLLSLSQEASISPRPLPRLIGLELIAECGGDSCSTPLTPVNILSRVRKPEGGEVARMLGLPQDGVPIGKLSLPDGREFEDEVKLPINALRHHVLTIGTTGSGKTVFAKNLIYDVVGRRYGKALALDVVGHYMHVIGGGIGEIVVLYPVTEGRLRQLVRGLKHGGIRELTRRFLRRFIKGAYHAFGLNVRISKIGLKARHNKAGNTLMPLEAWALCRYRDIEFKLKVIPWALRSRRVLNVLPRLSTVFTIQARMFYERIMRELIREKWGIDKPTLYEAQVELARRGITLKDVYNALFDVKSHERRAVTMYEYIAERLGIHRGTLENIARGLLSLVETRLIDVMADFKGLKIIIDEPRYDDIFENSRYIVVDLRFTSVNQQRLIVYRVLDRLYHYVSTHRVVDGVYLVVIDEAHTFFPQTREESEKELIENCLTKLARLGRARGIGLLFATHSPEDLNDLVIQLTNTKVLLRSDERLLERLGVPASERKALSYAPPGVAYIKSFVYKTPLFVRIHGPKAPHAG